MTITDFSSPKNPNIPGGSVEGDKKYPWHYLHLKTLIWLIVKDLFGDYYSDAWVQNTPGTSLPAGLFTEGQKQEILEALCRVVPDLEADYIRVTKKPSLTSHVVWKRVDQMSRRNDKKGTSRVSKSNEHPDISPYLQKKKGTVTEKYESFVRDGKTIPIQWFYDLWASNRQKLAA